ADSVWTESWRGMAADTDGAPECPDERGTRTARDSPATVGPLCRHPRARRADHSARDSFRDRVVAQAVRVGDLTARSLCGAAGPHGPNGPVCCERLARRARLGYRSGAMLRVRFPLRLASAVLCLFLAPLSAGAQDDAP